MGGEDAAGLLKDQQGSLMFESYEEDYAAAAKQVNAHISQVTTNEGKFGKQGRSKHII
jgi:hypothetical protein